MGLLVRRGNGGDRGQSYGPYRLSRDRAPWSRIFLGIEEKDSEAGDRGLQKHSHTHAGILPSTPGHTSACVLGKGASR